MEIDPLRHKAYLHARELLLNGPLTAETVVNTKKVEVFYLYGPSGCGKSLNGIISIKRAYGIDESML